MCDARLGLTRMSQHHGCANNRIDATSFECPVCYQGTVCKYDESRYDRQLKSQIEHAIVTEGNFPSQLISQVCRSGHLLCKECHEALWTSLVVQRKCPICLGDLLNPDSIQSRKIWVFSHEEALLRGKDSDSAEARKIERLRLEAEKWELGRPAREECERQRLMVVQEQEEIERRRVLGIKIITASMDGRTIVCTFRNIKCDHCQLNSEIGVTFRCNLRENYDLCNKCMLTPTETDRVYTYTRHESPMLQEESCDGEQTLNQLPDYSVPRMVNGIDQHAFTDYVMDLCLYQVIKFQAGHCDEDILMHMQHRPYIICHAEDGIRGRRKRHVNRIETSVWNTMQNIDGANLLGVGTCNMKDATAIGLDVSLCAPILAPSAIASPLRSQSPKTTVEKKCLSLKTGLSFVSAQAEAEPSITGNVSANAAPADCVKWGFTGQRTLKTSARQRITKPGPQNVDISPLSQNGAFVSQQITYLLCKYAAQHSNAFKIYENIGLTSEIRRALVAYIDSVRGNTSDDKIEIGLSEIVNLLTVAAGREACCHFMANIEGIFPAREFKIILRRTESDGIARCIAFHKDDTLYTMAIPLNAPEDKCTGGQLVYLNEAGSSYIPRDTNTLTLHDNTILHGITAHTHGVRWGMYLLTPPIS